MQESRSSASPCSIQTKTGGPRHIHHGWTNVESPATNAEQQVSREQEIVRRAIVKTFYPDLAHRIRERSQGTQHHHCERHDAIIASSR